MDKDKLEATGKLVKTYKKDGKQFGVIDLKVSAPITGLGEKSPVKVKDGSMVVTMAGDGCIDGTSAEGKSTMVMKFTVEGGVQGADLKVDATVTENRTSAPLPKK